MQLKVKAVRRGLPGLQSWLCYRGLCDLGQCTSSLRNRNDIFVSLSAPPAETADERPMRSPSLGFAPLADIANQLWASAQPRDLSGAFSTACSGQTSSIHWCFCARLNHPYVERTRPRSLGFWLLQNSGLPPVATSSSLLQQHQPTWGALGRTITPPRDIECFFSRHPSELEDSGGSTGVGGGWG